MSLLGTQVYANPSTPCWLGTSGGTISGNLVVDGNIGASGSVTAGQGFVTVESASVNGFSVLNTAQTQTVTNIQHLPAPSSRTVIQSGDPFVFAKVGASNGNTVLTTSAFGANTDQLEVLGTIQTLNLSANKLSLLGSGSPAPAAVVGTATITVASTLTYVIVNTTAVTATSKIFVSHAAASVAGPGNGGAQGGLTVNPTFIVPGVSFRIDLVAPATGIAVAPTLNDVPINWLIIG
jgi:hypothetical protein